MVQLLFASLVAESSVVVSSVVGSLVVVLLVSQSSVPGLLILATKGKVEAKESTGRPDRLRILFIEASVQARWLQPGLGRRSAAGSHPALRLPSESACKEKFNSFSYRPSVLGGL